MNILLLLTVGLLARFVGDRVIAYESFQSEGFVR